MNNEFVQALKKHQSAFDLNLPEEKFHALAEFYELVRKHNDILHLVAPCTPKEFAVRHILESLYATHFLPENTKFADVGTGAGLPAVPCLIVREDLHGVLIESKLKKVNFLEEVLAKCELKARAGILNRQFEELEKPDVSYITCRALDKFSKKLPKLLKWSDNSSFLFFGGNALRDELEKLRLKFEEKLLPMSEQRYLFISRK